MTKVLVIGKPEKKEFEKKPIEFVNYLDCNFKFSKRNESEGMTQPCEYKFIDLICYDYAEGYDLMLAYDEVDERGEGTLYKGHFNDGVV